MRSGTRFYARRALLQLDRVSGRGAYVVASDRGRRGGVDGIRAPAPALVLAILLSRAAATLVLWMGRLTGQVPRSVRRHLDYCSFGEFCRYNVHTETTAWLCWQRLTELAAQLPEIPPEQVREFRRIADDEEGVTAACSTCSPMHSLTATGRETMSPRTSFWWFANAAATS